MKKRLISSILIAIFVLMMSLVFVGCNADVDNVDKGEETMKNPVITIEMENGKTIKAELYPEKAPNTVNNFISLASSGFYDGLIFHRVIYGFMIQGGDPAGIGTGGPGYCIKGEFALNGFTQNDLKHERGVLSMARAASMDSAGSQFFIMQKNASHLDGQYAAFGKVTEGIEVVDEIASVSTDWNDKPKIPQTMKKVKIGRASCRERVYRRV